MNIKIDSRKIVEGDTFIAIREINGDGHKYVEDAIKNGATIFLESIFIFTKKHLNIFYD